MEHIISVELLTSKSIFLSLLSLFETLSRRSAGGNLKPKIFVLATSMSLGQHALPSEPNVDNNIYFHFEIEV
jgi:hypothetical protein